VRQPLSDFELRVLRPRRGEDGAPEVQNRSTVGAPGRVFLL